MTTSNLKITVNAPKPTSLNYPPHPKFGTVFVPTVFKMTLERGQTSGFKGSLDPMGGLDLQPGTSALHYGQSIFEGLKAFRQKTGDGPSIAIFRPELNANRFVESARRMMMAEVPEHVFLDAITTFVSHNAAVVPHAEDHSLYLRPLLFGADDVIKVGAAQKYVFLVMGTIAGSYFNTGSKGVTQDHGGAKVMISREYVRAFPGGTGEAKTAGNYAASIRPQAEAATHGCDQVLYLDAQEKEYVDELGGMNFFFVRGQDLVTPALNGCILKGVTRSSILELAPRLDLRPKEEKVSVTDLIRGIEDGSIQECFACGTAAVVSPISALYFQDKKGGGYRWVHVSNTTITQRLYKLLSDVQRGLGSPAGWLHSVNV
jgi:branched-chain amino acid aminotransferase